jgi:hypothetical protein
VQADIEDLVSERLLTAAELVDLSGGDLRVGTAVDARHTSMNHAAANEADDVDDLANPGQLLAAVLVEDVDVTRHVVRDERDAEGLRLRHNETMAGARR